MLNSKSLNLCIKAEAEDDHPVDDWGNCDNSAKQVDDIYGHKIMKTEHMENLIQKRVTTKTSVQ